MLQNVKMGWLGVVRRHSRSSAMLSFGRAHTTSYSSLIETNASIWYRFRDTASYLSKFAVFNLPHLHLAPSLRTIPFEFHNDLWHQKTRVLGLSYSCGVVCLILPSAKLVELLTRDSKTQGHNIYRAIIAFKDHRVVYNTCLTHDRCTLSGSN